MTYKHKTHAVDSEGKITSNADIDFYIDDVSLLRFLYTFFSIVSFQVRLKGNNCNILHPDLEVHNFGCKKLDPYFMKMD